jgi:hypothetical protein
MAQYKYMLLINPPPLASKACMLLYSVLADAIDFFAQAISYTSKIFITLATKEGKEISDLVGQVKVNRYLW